MITRRPIPMLAAFGLAFMNWPVCLAVAGPAPLLPRDARLPNLQARLPFLDASYLDLVTRPGRLLYRFDSAIYNAGPGAFEVFYDHRANRVWQILYRGKGVASRPLCRKPPARQPAGGCTHAGRVPSDRNLAGRVNMTAKGAKMTWAGDNHAHWHVQGVARYTLTSRSGAALDIRKTGFCMYDLLGAGTGLYSGFNWAGNDWCQHRKGLASRVVRMGISPGFADHYAHDIAGQFVDVTGQAPGVYKLTAIIDPKNIVAETNEKDQSLTQLRKIPGVIAANLGPIAVPAGTLATLTMLPAQIVAPRAKVKTSVEPPRVWSQDEIAAGLVYSVTTPPAHGVIGAFSGPVVMYQPTPGYVGPDRFTYTVNDPRGLVSAPATVSVTVS